MNAGVKRLEMYARQLQAAWRGSKVRLAFQALKDELQGQQQYNIRLQIPDAELTRPSGTLRQVQFSNQGPLGFAFDAQLQVVEVDHGSAGELAGVRVGWVLFMFNGRPMTNFSREDIVALMTATPRPWFLTFQMTDAEEHDGRSFRNLVDAIQQNLDIDPGLSIKDTVAEAIRLSGVANMQQSLHSTVLSLCYHLKINPSAEPIPSIYLSGCLNGEFDAKYDYIGEANGKPHWASADDAKHLFYGCNYMWLLRRTFELGDPNATAFFEPPTEDTDLHEGQLEFCWFDADSASWTQSCVTIGFGSPLEGSPNDTEALTAVELSVPGQLHATNTPMAVSQRMRIKVLQEKSWERVER